MSLNILNLKESYRSSCDDLAADFFGPCLEHAVTYDRAAGYFSSHVFSAILPGLKTFIKNGGGIRLVSSPILSEDDHKAILDGADPTSQINERLLSEIKSDEFFRDSPASRQILSWLLANKYLQIKFAINTHVSSSGIYHEKMGLFRDLVGNEVAFTGSNNETINALYFNFEHLDVYASWDGDGINRRVSQKRRYFDTLWSNHTNRLKVVPLSEAIESAIIEAYSTNDAEFYAAVEAQQQEDQYALPTSAKYQLPNGIALHPYQEEALESWFQKNGKGILAMATGTGKTFTAIGILNHLKVKVSKPILTIIICPFLHLAEAWRRTLESCKFQTIGCYGQSKTWGPQFDDLVQSYFSSSEANLAAIVTTNSSFQQQPFQQRLDHLQSHSSKIILVADEVHNFGSEKLGDALPDFIKKRLGLSATWQRHMDEEGTELIAEYFGGEIFNYSIAKAIEEERLCPYEYHIIPIPLEEEELDAYCELTKKIGKAFAMLQSTGEGDESLSMLLIKRARLIATAQGKLPTLIKLIQGLKQLENAIIYVGDGVYLEDQMHLEEDSIRYIDSVTRQLGIGQRLKIARFTCEESMPERLELIESFKSGDIDALVAIKCLDEGVDIPSIKNAFLLASSSNPRQYIQRRGRILRKEPGKEKACLYDFLVVPEIHESGLLFDTERRLIYREMQRVQEFSKSALNSMTALDPIRDYLEKFNLNEELLECETLKN
jgi:superfamily II DNA or RNA helicase